MEEQDYLNNQILDVGEEEPEEIVVEELKTQLEDDLYEFIAESLEPDQKTITTYELQKTITEYYLERRIVLDDEGIEPKPDKAITEGETTDVADSEEVPTPEILEPEKAELDQVRLILGDDMYSRFIREMKIDTDTESVRTGVLREFIREYIRKHGLVRLAKEDYTLDEIKSYFGDLIYEEVDSELGSNGSYRDSENINRKIVEKILERHYLDIIKKEEPEEILEEIDDIEKIKIEETKETEPEVIHKPEVKPRPTKKIKKKSLSMVKNDELRRLYNLKLLKDLGICCPSVEQLLKERTSISKYELTNHFVEIEDEKSLKRLHDADFCKDMVDMLTYLNSKYGEDFNFKTDYKTSVTFKQANDFVYTPMFIKKRLKSANMGYMLPILEEGLKKIPQTTYSREEIKEVISGIDGEIDDFTRNKLLDILI